VSARAGRDRGPHPNPELDRAVLGQPLLLAIGYALGQAVAALTPPHLVIGHSVGEIAAAGQITTGYALERRPPAPAPAPSHLLVMEWRRLSDEQFAELSTDQKPSFALSYQASTLDL
jgi:hypothetical protein